MSDEILRDVISRRELTLLMQIPNISISIKGILDIVEALHDQHSAFGYPSTWGWWEISRHRTGKVRHIYIMYMLLLVWFLQKLQSDFRDGIIACKTATFHKIWWKLTAHMLAVHGDVISCVIFECYLKLHKFLFSDYCIRNCPNYTIIKPRRNLLLPQMAYSSLYAYMRLICEPQLFGCARYTFA